MKKKFVIIGLLLSMMVCVLCACGLNKIDKNDKNDKNDKEVTIDWKSLYLEKVGTWDEDYIEVFALNDVNNDGIPELFVKINNSERTDSMFRIKDDGLNEVYVKEEEYIRYYDGNGYIYGSWDYSWNNSLTQDFVYKYDSEKGYYETVKLLECDHNKYKLNGDTISKTQYNVELKEIEKYDWKDGQVSEYSSKKYGRDIKKAIAEYAN